MTSKRPRLTGGKHTPLGRLRDRLAYDQGWICHWCRRWMYAAGEHSQLGVTADHVTPLSRGGSNGLANIVAACAQCNHHRDTIGDPLTYKPHWWVDYEYKYV